MLSFELIGINFRFEENRTIFTKIIDMMVNAKRDIPISILINYLLRMIYKERKYQKVDMVTVEAIKNDANSPIERKLEAQINILNDCTTCLEKYILFATGREDHKEWKKGKAENLIYQFIYRNYYGLEKPDILPGLLEQNKLMVNRFLNHYHLKIYDVIDDKNNSWFRIASPVYNFLKK